MEPYIELKFTVVADLFGLARNPAVLVGVAVKEDSDVAEPEDAEEGDDGDDEVEGDDFEGLLENQDDMKELGEEGFCCG